MKEVILSFVKYALLIIVVIVATFIFKGNYYAFLNKYIFQILSLFFYSTGTLGFLVNVTTWGGTSTPEKLSKIILIAFYCLGTFFAIIGL